MIGGEELGRLADYAAKNFVPSVAAEMRRAYLAEKKKERDGEDIEFIKERIHETEGRILELSADLEALKSQGTGKANRVPKQVRIPSKQKGSKCPYLKMSRSSVLRLIKSGEIKIEYIRPPGEKKSFPVMIGSSIEIWLHRNTKPAP